MTNANSKEMTQTILNALGGNKFRVAVGVKSLIFDTDANSNYTLTIKFMNTNANGLTINCCRITLINDLYDIDFFKISGIKCILKCTKNNVFADELLSVFEETTKLHTTFKKGEL